ncbi:MAG: prepilin-type N-terminal cleavage/methylation domain-containing protein [Verrucomicrobia bacterium]|nr:prepilin-type N-terminal cleavage/methylation domain-containing protein [Verrucomicrobiota bacterium]MCF7707312.1 prepilin-type N-terminal cleavage/methylation domain-containing protein [Verrucomicrobiota bacterium]
MRFDVMKDGQTGFTLLEVLIAMAIFFVAIFAILDLTNQNIKMARMLKPGKADLGIVATEIAMTNKLEVGAESGDFGELYPEYSWAREVFEVSTNGLFEVRISVFKSDKGLEAADEMSILLYRPESAGRSGM